MERARCLRWLTFWIAFLFGNIRRGVPGSSFFLCALTTDVGAFFVGGLRGGYRRGKSFCAMLGDGLKNGFMEIFVHNVLFE